MTTICSMRLSADSSALFDAQPASAPTENASIQFLLIHCSLQVLVLLTRSSCSRLRSSRKQLSILRLEGQWSCSQHSGIEWLQSAAVLPFAGKLSTAGLGTLAPLTTALD